MMARNTGRRGSPAVAPGPGCTVGALEAALLERQTLLTGPNTPAARDRIDALGLRIDALLDRRARVHPPAALQDQTAAPGEFDRFLDRGAPQRRAG